VGVKPSNSTVASVGIGVPAATIISWSVHTFLGVEVPGEVQAALGAFLSAIVGYFFSGGRADDVA
jgi:hypothetical protein